MAKYRVLQGIYREDGRTYTPGQVVETKMDLSRQNRGSRKYERVEDDPAEQDAVLGPMTVLALRALAAEEGIDLETATKKDEIINTIKSERAERENQRAD